MPLIQRPNPSWMAFQEILPGTPTGGPRSELAAGWPAELPSPNEAGGTPAWKSAGLPRLPAQEGTTPTGRGRPNRRELGFGTPGAAATGAPAMGHGRSSIFQSPSY